MVSDDAGSARWHALERADSKRSAVAGHGEGGLIIQGGSCKIEKPLILSGFYRNVSGVENGFNSPLIDMYILLHLDNAVP